MSKYRVNVCLPPSAASDVEGALAKAMAPFDMNRGDAFDPEATWDWYRVDAGRQRFAVKPRHDGDPRLIHADPSSSAPRTSRCAATAGRAACWTSTPAAAPPAPRPGCTGRPSSRTSSAWSPTIRRPSR